MPEVPEHLLQRSRERRAALGMSTGGDTPAGAPAEGASAAPATTGEAAPAPAAAAAPVVVEEPAAPVGPSPAQLKLQAHEQRKIPTWVFPALVALPFWAILYIGAFGSHKHVEAETPAQVGSRVYAANCSSCHGGAGQGGAGPALAGGQAALTFPNEEDHITWVHEGSQTKPRGTPYGDPAREGGQHTVQSGGMPSFQGKLTEEEIAAVVTYERGL
jgi:mono/diheme cytochrome c family protein